MEENTVQTAAAEGGEWKIDVAEMMRGVTDDAEPAMDPKAEKGAGDESFTLRHLGETKNVGRDEVIALAQKGMDYDRIRGKLGDASRELEALRAGESFDPDPAERRRRDFAGFTLDSTRMALAAPGCLVQHPLPARRGEEITDEVLEAHAADIFDEAENRLHVEKAVLAILLAGY